MLRTFWKPLLATGLAAVAGAPWAMAQEFKIEGPIEFEVQLDKAGPGKWLGISLDELTPVVKAQLGIEQGVVVMDVVGDSPAAKAGVKVHDIIVRVGETKLAAPGELIELVGKSEGALQLVILRSGKEQKIEVAPGKRPESPEGQATLALELPAVAKANAQRAEADAELVKAREALERAMREFHAKRGDAGVKVMDRFGPAIVIRTDAAHALPDDLKIQYERTGNKPATIKVQRGEKKWETTMDKLDELPEEIRHFVRMSLAGDKLGPHGVFAFSAGDVKFPVPVGVPPTAAAEAKIHALHVRPHDEAMERVEAQLKEMRKQLDEVKAKLQESGK